MNPQQAVVFVRRLNGALTSRDLLFVFSGSGNSENVLLAAKYAKKQNTRIISATGFDGGALLPLADVALHVPVHQMQIAEDLHLTITHLLTMVLGKQPLC